MFQSDKLSLSRPSQVVELKRQIREQNMVINKLSGRLHDHQDVAVRLVDGKPESCGDLRSIGHSLSGFYDVQQGFDLVTVFCNFSLPSNDSGVCLKCSL